MFLELFLGIISLALLWDYLLKKQRNDVMRKSKIGGPISYPLIGGAFNLPKRKAESNLGVLHNIVHDHGKISYRWLFNKLSIFYADVKNLEVILSSPIHITKSSSYDMLIPWLGDGLLMSSGKKWHSRRKIITPTFHFKILEQFAEIFEQQGNVLVEKMQSKANGESAIDVFPLVCLAALDIIAETAMGVKVYAQTSPDIGYARYVKDVTEIMASRFRNPYWRLDILFRIMAPRLYRELMTKIALMQSFTKDVIQKRRLTLQSATADKQSTFSTEDSDIGAKKRMALLDVLLQAKNADGQPLSDEDIREEVETFMFEGHDTTTSGISFTLYLISRHPEVQQRLFEEIHEIFGNNDKNEIVSAPVIVRRLQELKYMECVLKEAMRLHPPVAIIGRYLNEDIQINDKTLPAHSHITIPLFVVLRDPDYFPNPDSFQPDRFLASNANDISPFAYIPFSAGPRNCIGQKYAMLEMKSTICKILRNFELLPLGPDIVPILNLIMRSKTGMQLGLRPRKYI